MIYKLSTDYKKLYELVTSGEGVACFVFDPWLGVTNMAFVENGAYGIDIETASQNILLRSDITLEEFSNFCKGKKIEWIVPSAEVDCE